LSYTRVLLSVVIMITEKQLDCGGGSEQKVHFSVILSNKQNVWVHWNYSQTAWNRHHLVINNLVL